jgi:hypothetical protein
MLKSVAVGGVRFLLSTPWGTCSSISASRIHCVSVSTSHRPYTNLELFARGQRNTTLRLNTAHLHNVSATGPTPISPGEYVLQIEQNKTNQDFTVNCHRVQTRL